MRLEFWNRVVETGARREGITPQASKTRGPEGKGGGGEGRRAIIIGKRKRKGEAIAGVVNMAALSCAGLRPYLNRLEVRRIGIYQQAQPGRCHLQEAGRCQTPREIITTAGSDSRLSFSRSHKMHRSLCWK